MNKARIFATFVVLAMLLNATIVGPVEVYSDDGAGSEPDLLCSQPPIVDAGEYNGDEGSAIALDQATAVDPEGDPLTYSWSVDTDLCTFDDASLLHPNLTCLDDGAFTARLCARQHSDAPITSAGIPTVCDDAPVTVHNIAPTCEGISATPDKVSVNTPITFSADFTDPGVLDTHTAAWNWGDGTSSTGTITQGAGSGSVNDEYSYSTAGEYTVRLVITDNYPADSNECTYTVKVVDETCPSAILVNPPIPWRPATRGEVFFSTTVSVPEIVPDCPGCFCLSTDPNECNEIVIDDRLAVFLDGTEVFDYDFAPGCVRLTRAIVKLSQSTSEQIAGQTITIEYQDKCGGGIRADEVWLVPTLCGDGNQPPIVDPDAYSGDEGSAIALNQATASDPDGDPLAYSWSVDTDLCTFDDASLLHPNLTCLDDGAFTATLTVDDGHNRPVTGDAPITVYNVAPTLGPISAVQAPVPVNTAVGVNQIQVFVNTPVSFGADFTDPGTLDTHTAAWDWGDGTSSTGTVAQGAGSGSVSDQHSFSAKGEYTVRLVVTDNYPADSNERTYTVMVVDETCPSAIPVGPPVPWRPATRGEIFFSTTVSVPEPVPGCPDCFCLSTDPNECNEIVIDDRLAVLLDGKEIYSYDFAPGCVRLTRAIVKIPRSTSEQIAGQAITIEYQDKCGGGVRADEVWLVPISCGDDNQPPVVNPGAYSGDEGSTIALSDATASDPEGDPLSYSWSVDTDLCTFDDPSLLHPNLTCLDDGAFTATLTVDDGHNPPVAGDAPITVHNVAPTLGPISAVQAQVPVHTAVGVNQIRVFVNTPISFSADFTDPGALDTHTAAWDWGDGTSSTGTVTQGAGSGSVSDQHSYSAKGEYTVRLVVTDNYPADSNERTYTVVVVDETCPAAVPVSPPVSWRPATVRGEVFYSTQVSVPEIVPGCPECFCLSSDPNECKEILIDDRLAVFLDGQEIFYQDFAPCCQRLERAIVELPRSTSEQIAGQTITIEYQDKCGAFVRADEVWLVPAPCPKEFPIFVGPPVSQRPAAYQGEAFYTQSMRIPNPLPDGGSFYLSSFRDRVGEIIVDDRLAVYMDCRLILDVDFARGYPLPDPPRNPIRLERQIVEIPRSTMEQIAGQRITVQYQDVYAGSIRSDQDVWLIWVP